MLLNKNRKNKRANQLLKKYYLKEENLLYLRTTALKKASEKLDS